MNVFIPIFDSIFGLKRSIVSEFDVIGPKKEKKKNKQTKISANIIHVVGRYA